MESALQAKHKKTGIGKALIISISILVLLVAAYFLIPPFKSGINEAYDVLTSKNEKRIQSWVEQFGMGGPIILVLLMVVQMFLFIVPNILVMMIAIISYGPVWGSIISILGVFASSSLGYFIGKQIGYPTLNRFISEKTFNTISSFIERYGAGAIAVTRLASLCNDSLGFAAGILRMSYHKYILATIGGITPLVVLLALYGRNGKIEKALYWIAGATLAILIVYIFIDKRRLHKKKPASQAIEQQYN